MSPLEHHHLNRRDFLATSASGLGGVALASMLAEDGLLASVKRDSFEDPLLPRKPHFDAKAKACIFIFMAGAPSQLDLFDPKPKLNEMAGERLPKSLLEKARFAFIKPATATLMGTKRTFKKYGQSGMEFSDIVPHLGSVADDVLMVRSMHSDEFNHHPGQLQMQCGVSHPICPPLAAT